MFSERKREKKKKGEVQKPKGKSQERKLCPLQQAWTLEPIMIISIKNNIVVDL